MNKLINAVLENNLEVFKKILNKNPNEIEIKDENGIWITFIAAKLGHFDIVKFIVEYSRASMNEVDCDNKNILHYASYSDNVLLVKYLVEIVGMSPVSYDKNLITPFHIAKNENNVCVLKYFESVCKCKFENMYSNPILKGAYADPSIVRVNDDYYMVNSSFTFFPSIPISHSKDLINWTIIGHAITDVDYADLKTLESGRGYWAPDISYYEGLFYITATYRLNDTGEVYRKQIVVKSKNAEGPYSKPVFFDEDGIDPSIFNDDDGKRYMLLNRGARIFEINADATKQVSESKLLWYGDNKRAPEGPHIIKKDGFYYLFVAEGGTGIGHRISVARSKDLMGTYESCPYNPIMIQNDTNATLQRVGHGKPIKTQNDEWFIVYLCGRILSDKYTILGRETNLDPITWTKDGWPIINNAKGPSVLQKKPELKEHLFKCTNNDNFDEKTLSNYWVSPRAIYKDSFKIQDSYLCLKGSLYDLYNINSRNVFLKRQTSFIFTATTKMCYNFERDNDNAGMTCYYDENTYLKFGMFFEKNKYILKVVEHIGEDETISFSLDLTTNVNSEIRLKIVTNYFERSFYYSTNDDNFIFIGKLDNVYYLSDEGYSHGKRFTGAMTGLYAVSKNASEKYIARFDYFDINMEVFYEKTNFLVR